ncbi:hypothetical protein EMIT0P2_120159 [Pseudomonas sp. IT-P2]
MKTLRVSRSVDFHRPDGCLRRFSLDVLLKKEETKLTLLFVNILARFFRY